MSIRAMNWAWELVLPPVPKLLLMALADAADDDGNCWPAVQTLATKSCLSIRTVQRLLKELEQSKILAVTPRFTSIGRQTSSLYKLEMAEKSHLGKSKEFCQGEGDNLSPYAHRNAIRGVTSDTLGVSKPCHPQGDTAMSPLEPPYEPKSEPPLQQRPSNGVQRTELHLPPGLSTKDRETVLGLVSDMNLDQAQELFDELAVAVQSGKVIKTTPVRWFRGLIRRCRAGDFSPTECAVLIRRQREQKMKQRLATPIKPPVNSAKAKEQAAKLLAQLLTSR